jgi:NADPH-dependent glutamate synthase beta subunit-like oxidoreductase
VQSVDELFSQGYDAVYLSIGAHSGMKMGVEGEESEGVIECVSFLRDVSLKKKVSLGDRVAVIGGGNAAMDAARTAIRLGSKDVTIVYRRTRQEMPADPMEIEEAMHEGVKFRFLAAPEKISRANGYLKMECIQMKLGAPDASGRRRPVPMPGSEFTLEVDNIIAAIGQAPEVPKGFNVETKRGNVIAAHSETFATSRAGVFAGGDAVTGPLTVTHAIAAGRKAASAIDKYLGGSGIVEEKLLVWGPTTNGNKDGAPRCQAFR